MLSSALLAERRLASLVGDLTAMLADLAPDLKHHRIDATPHHQIVAGAPRRHPRQMRQHGASDLVHQFIDRVTPHQGALLFHDPDL